jgi:hypothetical protein
MKMTSFFLIAILVVFLAMTATATVSFSDYYTITSQLEGTTVACPHHGACSWSPKASRTTFVSSTTYNLKSNVNATIQVWHAYTAGQLSEVGMYYDTFATPLDLTVSTACVLSGASNADYGELFLTIQSSEYAAKSIGSFNSTSATWPIANIPGTLSALTKIGHLVKGNASNAIFDFDFYSFVCA